MKRKFSVLFFVTIVIFLTSSFSSYVKAQTEEDPKLPDPDFELKLAVKGNKQAEMVDEILKYYNAEGFSEEEVEDIGYFYFSDDGESIIFQKPNEDQFLSEKSKKIDKVIEKAKNKFGKDKVAIKEVKYTYKDLQKLLDGLNKDKLNLNISSSGTSILVDKEKIELITPSITTEQKENLQEKYGDVLVITVDETYNPTFYKTRTEDWNKMGGGLGIKYRDSRGYAYNCSTGGVVYKNSTYYVLTAGHCTAAAASPFYQYEGTLGYKHPTFNAFSGGLDVGLVIPNNSPIARYAYNGIFIGTRYASISDYNGNMTSAQSYTSLNQIVCKSGITTGWTCGQVTKVTHTTPDGFLVTIAEKDSSQGIYAGQGDSGGAVTLGNSTFTGLVQGGNPVATLPTGERVGYDLFFTRWGDFGPQYDLYFYTSSSQTLMPN